MNISIRLFAGFFLVVGLAAWFVLNIFSQEIAPGIRQATEETLVDSANLLAEIAAPELAAGTINTGKFAAAIRSGAQRQPAAKIFDISKSTVDLRVYVTDAKGIVQFDTEPGTIGADYSQWRDVALVLRGEYGARSSRSDQNDVLTTSMYIAAPIVHKDQLIGVLTVAKPSASILPYLQRAEERVRHAGFWLIGVASLIGIAFTFWLASSINRLRNYAIAMAEGRAEPPPTLGGKQFAELARTLAVLRERLDGKQYVETYVQNLAHEMKSPLTAITGAAELLQAPLPDSDRAGFVDSINMQARRMREIIDRMLQLAHLEQLQVPSAPENIGVGDLLQEAVAERQLSLGKRQLLCTIAAAPQLRIAGDRLLLRQALLNLLDNAIDFSPVAGQIELRAAPTGNQIDISVRDHGAGAPDYAVDKLFERFYSLPHPASGEKGTGLGLPLVNEIARLHGGTATFRNHPEGGGIACLSLPAA